MSFEEILQGNLFDIIKFQTKSLLIIAQFRNRY